MGEAQIRLWEVEVAVGGASRTPLAFLLLIAIIAGVVGCSPAGARLEGTGWRLTAWSASSLDPLDFKITAVFSGGQISGASVINSYSGPYTSGPGTAFSAGPLTSTLIAGPEPAMRAEVIYAELLGEARSCKVEGTTLTLFDANGNQSLVFERAK